MAKKAKKVIPTAENKKHLIELIEQEHGEGSIMLGRGSIVNVSAFSTGIASIDVALGCGGLPQGRIMEIYGPESGGKTTTCLQFIAACQKHRFESKDREGVAAFRRRTCLGPSLGGENWRRYGPIVIVSAK